MTAADKKKVEILALLLLIAGGVWIYVSRYRATVVKPAVVQTTKAKGGKKKPKSNEPREVSINTSPLDAAAVADGVGRKNIFEYRQKPLPPAPPVPPAIKNTTPIALPPQVSSIPIAPPPPQMKSFRYEGYSSKSGRITGSVSEGSTTYQVTEGECLMGIYCVRRLTENLVEIEDLQLKQRRSFTRSQ